MAGAHRFMCCFCGESIEPRTPDPVGMLIPLRDGGSQELWCHLVCVQRVLHPSIPLAIFEEEEDE